MELYIKVRVTLHVHWPLLGFDRVIVQRTGGRRHSLAISLLPEVTGDTSGYSGLFHVLKILVIDDFGLSALKGNEASDLLEVLEDRSERKSTIVTSQLPIDSWHEALRDPTISDAVLDRLLCNAHILSMTVNIHESQEVQGG